MHLGRSLRRMGEGEIGREEGCGGWSAREKVWGEKTKEQLPSGECGSVRVCVRGCEGMCE